MSVIRWIISIPVLLLCVIVRCACIERFPLYFHRKSILKFILHGVCNVYLLSVYIYYSRVLIFLIRTLSLFFLYLYFIIYTASAIVIIYNVFHFRRVVAFATIAVAAATLGVDCKNQIFLFEEN